MSKPGPKTAGGELEYVAPMKPVLVQALPPDTALWSYEVKFDGYRAVALKRGKAVELWSGSHKPLDFPEVAAALAELPCRDAILDGEVVALDSAGRSSFQLLQGRGEPGGQETICLYLFDLLRLDGKDLRKLPTEERKSRLAALLARAPGDARLRFSADLRGEPAQILAAVKRLGLEGVVAKSRAAGYQAGVRSPAWQKVKLVAEQDFVIGGYTPPEGTRRHFGALLVGYHQEGELRYAARVGSGFTVDDLARYHRMFQEMRAPACPFVNLPDRLPSRWGQGITPAKMRQCAWLQPVLVCRVRFAEWTDDGGLRQPVFLGLREDKDPGQVGREPAPD